MLRCTTLAQIAPFEKRIAQLASEGLEVSPEELAELKRMLANVMDEVRQADRSGEADDDEHIFAGLRFHVDLFNPTLILPRLQSGP
jgi:hypothetical protein